MPKNEPQGARLSERREPHEGPAVALQPPEQDVILEPGARLSARRTVPHTAQVSARRTVPHTAQVSARREPGSVPTVAPEPSFHERVRALGQGMPDGVHTTPHGKILAWRGVGHGLIAHTRPDGNDVTEVRLVPLDGEGMRMAVHLVSHNQLLYPPIHVGTPDEGYEIMNHVEPHVRPMRRTP